MKRLGRNLLSVLLTLTLLVGLLPGMTLTARADGNVAKVGDDGYATLASAIEAVSGGGTVTLLQDTTITTPLQMNKSYTLDFNNCTVSYNTTATTTISGASTIVFENGTLDISGAQMPGKSAGNDIFSFNADGNTLTFDKMHLYGEGYSGYSVFWFKGNNTTPVNTLNFENGSIIELKNEANSSGGVIKGPGAYHDNEFFVVNFLDSTVSCTNVYRFSLYGTINVTDSTVTFTGGENAFRKGIFTFDHATVTVSGAAANEGKAISPQCADTKIKNGSTLTLTGSNIGKDVCFEHPQNIEVDATSTLTVSAVYGSADDRKITATEGYALLTTKNADNTTTYQAGYIAMIGDVGYASLAEAVGAADTGDTITLVADDNVSLTDGSEITIGKSLTITGAVDSNGEPLYAIYGKSDANVHEEGVYHDIFLASSTGTITVSNVKIAQFANQVNSKIGVAPLFVSSGNNKAVFDNVVVSDINCTGIKINGGEFEINNCTIDCAKTTGTIYTKGVEIVNAATGSITGTTIVNVTGANNCAVAGIEAQGSGNVTVSGCTITGINQYAYGISTSTNEGYTAGSSEVTVSESTVTAENPLYNDSDQGAKIIVSSGKYDGVLYSTVEDVIKISGGKFSFDPDETMIEQGYGAFDNTDSDSEVYPFRVCIAANQLSISAETYDTAKIVYFNIDEEKSLNYTVDPNTVPVEWTSSNPDVATVNDGVVSAHSAGSAVITAVARNLSASVTVEVKDGNYLSYNEFIKALVTGSGTFDGSDYANYAKDDQGRLIVKWSPVSGCRAIGTNNHQYTGCDHETAASYETPNRVNGGCAQYQITNAMVSGNISISNVSFAYDGSNSFWYDANGWNGVGNANLPGEMQFENTGNITIENCAFDNVSVTPYHGGSNTESSLTVTNSVFTNNQKAGLRGINSKKVTVSDCTFTNCASGAVDIVQNNNRVDGDIVLTNNSIEGNNGFKLRNITNKVYVQGEATNLKVNTLFSYDTANTEVAEYLILYAGKYNLDPSNYTGTENSTSTDYVADGYAVFINADDDKVTYPYIILPAATITFNANYTGAAPASGTQTVKKGVETALDSVATLQFTREGFVFTGWNTEANPTEGTPGISYADGDKVTLNDDLNLFAQWVEPATAPTISGITSLTGDDALTYGYESGSITVTATAAEDTTYNLSYQWYSSETNSNTGGTVIENATDASYAIPTGKGVADSPLYYYCAVTATRVDNGQTATATSGVATVTIGKAANPLTYAETQTVTKTFSTSAQTETLGAAENAEGTLSYAIKSQKLGENDVTCFTLSGTTLSLAESTPVGTYTVVVTATAAGNGNYNSGSKDSTVTVTVGKANPTYTAPTGLTATYGQTLADVALPKGWSWNDAGTTSVGNVGSNDFAATFTPNDTTNYNTATETLSITVAPALTDLTDAVVTVNTEQRTVTVTLGSDTVPPEGYTLIFFSRTETEGGESLVRVGPDFPTEPGSYIAAIVGSRENGYTGEKRSDVFTVAIPAHTVTFDANGHGAAPAAQSVADGGKAAEPKAPEAEGWIFAAWYTEPACENEYDFNTPVKADMTLYAGWMTAGGEVETEGVTIQSEQKLESSLANLAEAELEKEKAKDSNVTEVRLTLHAALKEEETLTDAEKTELAEIRSDAGEDKDFYLLDLTVTKTVTRGEATTESSVYELGDGAPLAIRFQFDTLNRTAFRLFRYHSEDGSAEKGRIEELTRLDSIPNPVTAAHEGCFYVGDGYIIVYASKFSFYAVSYAEGHTVRFDTDGGEPVPADQIVPAGGKATRPQNDPAKPGYTFKDWYQADKETLFDFDYVVTEDVTVYALWTKKSQGGGGGGAGGGSAETLYRITVAETANGAVKADRSEAAAGAKVTLTVTPAEGHELDSIEVTDRNGKIALSENPDGTFSFLMPAGDVTVKAAFKATEPKPEPEPQNETCPRDETCPLSGFQDLDPLAWYHDGVHYALENGVMEGYGDGTFGPDDSATRAMLVTMLWRIEGKPVVDYAMDYTDVPENMWYTEAIRWGSSVGILEGYGDGTFGTNDKITREQLVTIFYRYAQHKGTAVSPDENILDYDDALEVSPWAVEAFRWSVQVKLVEGVGNNKLDPKGDATRAQIATIVMRYRTRIAA